MSSILLSSSMAPIVLAGAVPVTKTTGTISLLGTFLLSPVVIMGLMIIMGLGLLYLIYKGFIRIGPSNGNTNNNH